MAIFLQAFSITMGNEGGYCDNPNDHGGETYAGIASADWPRWQGWPIVHLIKSQNPISLDAALKANLNLQTEVTAFYKANFWDVLLLNSLNCQQTANQMFDIGVNMGVGIAARFLQEGINMLSPGLLTVDGCIGPKTIAAANAANEEVLYNEVIQLRRQRYLAIIANNPSQAVFENSWMSRIKPFSVALPA